MLLPFEYIPYWSQKYILHCENKQSLKSLFKSSVICLSSSLQTPASCARRWAATSQTRTRAPCTTRAPGARRGATRVRADSCITRGPTSATGRPASTAPSTGRANSCWTWGGNRHFEQKQELQTRTISAENVHFSHHNHLNCLQNIHPWHQGLLHCETVKKYIN